MEPFKDPASTPLAEPNVASLGERGRKDEGHASRAARTPGCSDSFLSFRVDQLSGLLWRSEYLAGMVPRLMQEPEHSYRAASGASPPRSRPWPAAACQAYWPTAAEPQPPASSAVWLEHPASAAMSSCAGQRQPMGVGEEHNQPFRSSAGSASWALSAAGLGNDRARVGSAAEC